MVLGRHISIRLFAAVLMSVLCWSGVTASEGLRTDVPFTNHLHRCLKRSDGLPSNWINAMVQTADNHVWIGTDNGLVRFDGVRFKKFGNTNSPGLPHNEIRALYEDADGSLWVGTTRGVARFRPGMPAKLERVPAFDDKTVYAFARDDEGTLWIGTEQETYKSHRTDSFEIDASAPNDVRAIAQDRDGTLWFGSNTGLFYRGGSSYHQVFHKYLPKLAPRNEAVPTRRINAIFCDDVGDLWIGTNRTLLHMRDRQFTLRGQELAAQQIYDIVQTCNGAIYVAARFGVYRSVAGSPFEEVSREPSAFCLLEDHAKGLWIGHGDNRGLHHYRNSHLRTVWDEALVSCIDKDDEGNIWFGARTGLYRLSEEGVEAFGTEQGLPNENVLSVAAGKTKQLWIGTASGLAYWSKTGMTTEGLPSELDEMGIGVVFEDSRGTLWFALTTDGGFSLKDGQLRELPPFRAGRIHFFWEDTDKSLLIGHESGLYRYRDGQFHRIGEQALRALLNPRFICHWPAPDGTLWIGTSYGIARYREGQLVAFPPNCGLLADNVERLAVDEEGNLWFGGRDGLFHADTSEFDDYAEGRLKKVTAYQIDGFERFPPVRAFSQAAFLSDGLLWLVHGGLVQLTTREFTAGHPTPTVRIEQIFVDGQSVDFDTPFAFSSAKRRLAIHFGEQPFMDSRNIQLRYRLDPFDEQWVDAGEDRRSEYTDLRPGNYVFSLSARHGNGRWSQAEHAPAFTVVPRWWERRLVQSGGVLLCCGLAILYARFRIAQVRASNQRLRDEIVSRQQAEEDSRRHLNQLARYSRVASMGELAASIAHEVKQPVSAILTDAETANCLLDKREIDLQQVREALRVITAGGHRVNDIVDRVRAIVVGDLQRNEEIDVNELVTSVLRCTESEFYRLQVEVSTQLAEELPSIIGNRIELQQVVMNLIMNGSQAMRDVDVGSRRLTVATSFNGQNVRVSVGDRGVGIEPSRFETLFEPFYTTKQQGMGMGLAISQTIVRAHGGEILAMANPDRGATFVVTLPVDHQAKAHS